MKLVCKRSFIAAGMCFAVASFHGFACGKAPALTPDSKLRAPDSSVQEFASFTTDFCIDCHSGADAEAKIDLEAMLEEPIAAKFGDWRKVQRVLSDRTMPPADSEQPSASRHSEAKDTVDSMVQGAINKSASDPGPHLLRRLTNAEYEYCIEDLTGIKFDLQGVLLSDNVGGSGFTNSSSAQFMNEATLERYLEAAKLIAEHAMIGAGSVYFYQDPGLTGLELSAIQRIQKIYQAYGFRASAGEGAKPFGLERYASAFQVAWQYRYREQLDLSEVTLEELAEASGISGRFAQHVWDVVQQEDLSFPLSLIAKKWRAISAPKDTPAASIQLAGKQAQMLFEELQAWQNRLSSAAGQEEAALLTGRRVKVPTSVDFTARAIRKRRQLSREEVPDLTNRTSYDADGTVRIELRVEHASANVGAKPAVVFVNPQFRFDLFDGTDLEPVPLASVLDDGEKTRLAFGKNPGGLSIGANDFAMKVGASKVINIQLPEDVRYGELTVTASIDPMLGRDAVVRTVISDVTSQYDPQLGVGSREYSALLRDTNSTKMDEWESGLTDFAAALPQISHREPTPSDRDPILSLYDNTYNLPERNYFHTAVKYHRDDSFFVERILPPNEVKALETAWTDLLTSFNYHATNFRFAAQKYKVQIEDTAIEADRSLWLERFPAAVQPILLAQKTQFDAMQRLLLNARQEHIRNVLDFASRAWRRPITDREADELRGLYDDLTSNGQLDHRQAIKSLFVRVLVAPDFLYRLENDSLHSNASTHAESKSFDVDYYELASRISFAIWCSMPDEELLRSARTGELGEREVLVGQVQRMLASPKSRRLATEFFGQWLGFYHFDEFRGVDTGRYPEFDEVLKNALYEEAISFFEHLVREDRPYHEIIQANYSFLDSRSAAHYGIELESRESLASMKLANAEYALDFRDSQADVEARKVIFPAGTPRGGLFGLAAILTTTSAPLRTSPVKRGDWILRRLLGTPVPPPPPDAGSIPAEEVLSDGLTIRQRLEAHRSQAECMNCHVRIDPLGFTLEHFDSLGRWRESYADNQPIDASGTLATGSEIEGFDGLREHLAEQDHAFRKTFATKLVAFFNGRAETVSDAALIQSVTEALEADPRISTAVLKIIDSVQFRRRSVSLEQGVLDEG